ncbi:MAG TPA: FecR family protein [Hyphomonas sp.]|nr:hypothetical protein [Hyphomonas sp.]HRJ00022.1 FecR family protein [Hyphomonas sp.]
MRDTDFPDPETPIQEAAAFWDARLRSPDCTDAERAYFRAWCAEDERHRAAYDALQAALDALQAARHQPEIRALRDAALAPRPRKSWRFAGIAAALAIAAVATPVAWMTLQDRGAGEQVADAPVYYATAVGQQSGITLEDGSVITLNTDSRVRVTYDASQRHIALLRGQALFEVAKEPNRPFVVDAGGKRVVALGTTFDVRLNGKDVEVTLVEGRVEIAEQTGAGRKDAPQRVRLEMGQRLVSSTREEPTVSEIDTSKATSWRDGFVTFEETPLIDAIAEMNRYSTVRIVAADSALMQLKVNGVFRSGQQARFAEALEEYFPVEAHRDGNLIVLKMSQPI